MIEFAARLTRLKAVRFGLVGVLNSIIDLTIFAASVALGAPALAANVLGWLVAVSFSYFANSRWSFQRDPALGDARSALRFVSLGALITLGVSSAVLLLLEPMMGAMAGKLTGMVTAAIVNFVAARWAIENRI